MSDSILGVFDDMPDDDYHAHPALSSSGARKLLAPSCPAIFDYERRNGEQKRREFDFGTAAHTLLLGSGPQPHVIDAENYKTKAAQAERDAAYERGDVPLLPAEFDAVQEMVSAVRNHPRAAELFTAGKPETSLFWTDPATGIACRARPDWLRADMIVDYKTSPSASPSHISKAVADFGYYMQADWYLTAAVELELLEPDAPFYFVFQSKNPPHLIKVVELDEVALDIGRDRNEQAREVFRDCTESGVWPDYGSDIELISLPAWEVRRHYNEGMFA